VLTEKAVARYAKCVDWCSRRLRACGSCLEIHARFIVSDYRLGHKHDWAKKKRQPKKSALHSYVQGAQITAAFLPGEI
jgi:hypothetical protein